MIDHCVTVPIKICKIVKKYDEKRAYSYRSPYLFLGWL